MNYVQMAQSDISRLRRQLVDSALLITSYLLPVLAFLSFLRVPKVGLQPVMYGLAGAALVVIATYLIRHKLSVRLKVGIIVALGLAIALESYASFEDPSRVVVILLIPVLVACVGLPQRFAFGMALLAAATPIALDLYNQPFDSIEAFVSRVAIVAILGLCAYLLMAHLIANRLIVFLTDARVREHRIERTDHVSGGLNELALRESIGELIRSPQAPVFRLYKLYTPELDAGNTLLSRDHRENLTIRLSANFTVHLPSNAVVGHLNTGSFVIIANRSDWSDVESSLRKLRHTKFTIGEQKLDFDPVVVTTDAPSDGTNAQQLLDNLARVLARARRDRLPFARFLPTDRALLDTEYLFVGELSQAMEQGDLKLFLQAKVDAHTPHRIVAAEALIRWHHPSQGLLSPAAFLQQIENSNARTNFALFVIKQSAQLLKELQAILPGFELSFNLGAYDLQELKVLAELQRVMDRYKFAKGTLQVEVSESETTVHVDTLSRAITEIKSLGYSCSLDDFGTGMSSLAYFSLIPVDTIKVDRALLAAIETSEVGRTVLQSIVDLCKGVGCVAVVEGVETQTQAEIVTEMGFDRIQGYFFGKPIEASQFKAMLSAQVKSEISSQQ